MELNSKIPDGPIANKWTNYKFDRKLVNPANRRKYDIIVVGTGLAGGAAAATLGEQGVELRLLRQEGGEAPLLVGFALGHRRLRPVHRVTDDSR